MIQMKHLEFGDVTVGAPSDGWWGTQSTGRDLQEVGASGDGRLRIGPQGENGGGAVEDRGID
jgi:hypothetical protein